MAKRVVQLLVEDGLVGESFSTVDLLDVLAVEGLQLSPIRGENVASLAHLYLISDGATKTAHHADDSYGWAS